MMLFGRGCVCDWQVPRVIKALLAPPVPRAPLAVSNPMPVHAVINPRLPLRGRGY
jgi:hypothetical protein